MPSRALWLISLSGLIPFVTCLVLAQTTPSLRGAAVETFLVYTALTLTFLGGARWGAELVRAPEAPHLGRLVASALPSLVALGALLPQCPPALGIGMLCLSSGAQLFWDVRDSRAGLLPRWNARVRTIMTGLGTVATLLMLPFVI